MAEYNYGMSGILKNTNDWLSRPSPSWEQPPGMVGTARAQLQLRQTFVYTKIPVMPPPEVIGVCP